MAHIETQSEWEERIGKEIIEYVISEIFAELPFMEGVLSALEPVGKEQVNLYATDGAHLFFQPQKLAELLERNERYLQRAYLHVILHCIYSHLWMRGARNPKVWAVACDIAVECVLDGLGKECTKRILSWIRQNTYRELDEQQRTSAAQIYEWLLDKDDEKLMALHREFYVDDHIFWPGDKGEQNSPMEVPKDIGQQWEKRARQLMLKNDREGENAQESLKHLAEIIRLSKNRRSYRDFLRRFAETREELRINPDEFDVTMYTYGLRTYGNLPLVEPVETVESTRVREFVIVVDTSYSTKGELVQKFLEHTLNIMAEEENFFCNSQIRLLQCDDEVRCDKVIKPGDEARRLLQAFELEGGGNTDFRPAFVHINSLLEKGEIENLGGVLYFTDGKGIYPKKRPAYKTAFVYLQDFEEEKVPAWAYKYRLENDFS